MMTQIKLRKPYQCIHVGLILFLFFFLSRWAPNLHNDCWRFFPFFLLAQIWFNRLVSDLATRWALNPTVIVGGLAHLMAH